jgi:F0F1-type ATP synthase epsilon subunit
MFNVKFITKNDGVTLKEYGVNQLSFQTPFGIIGIRSSHSPIIGEVLPCKAKLKLSYKTRFFKLEKGFFHVNSLGNVVIITDKCDEIKE